MNLSDIHNIFNSFDISEVRMAGKLLRNGNGRKDSSLILLGIILFATFPFIGIEPSYKGS